MIVKPTGNQVPLVVPVARVRHGLELDLAVVQLRSLVALVGWIILLNMFDHEGIRLTKFLFRVGRVGILRQDGLEVCISCVLPSVSLALHAPLFTAGKARMEDTYRQQPGQTRGYPCVQGHDDSAP